MAIVNPNISGYKPFYIQIGNNCYDTLTQWGFIAKSNPYPALPDPKEPYKNEWLDANGDDEYATSLYYQSFEFEVGFYIRANGETPEADIRTKMSTFFNAIKDGEFKVYDSFTGIGRQKVRYAGFKEDKFESDGQYTRCFFSVTFKVNDPVTFMKYQDGSIVAV